MAIQSDENGFLVGQTVDDIKRANKNTTAILKEVKDIKKLLSGIRSQQNQGQNQQRGQGQPPRPDTQPPRPRQSQSNNSDSGNESNNNQRVNNRSEQANSQQSNNTNNAQSNNASNQQSTANNTGNTTLNANSNGNSGTINTDDNLPPNTQLNDAPVRQETVEPNDSAAPRLRDANGRFIRNGEQQTAEPSTGRRRNSRGQFSSDNDSDKDTKNVGSLSGLFDGLGDRITTAIDAGNDLQEADPTVKAFQETVEPMAKGYRFVFGSGSAKDKSYFAWFKRIWRTLKNTEENTEEANRLNGTSILGVLLTAAIVAFGVFSKDGQAFFGKLKEIFVDPVINWVKESSGYNKAVDWTSENVVSPVMNAIDNPTQAFIDAWKLQLELIGKAWDLTIGSLASTLAPYLTDAWNSMLQWLSQAIMPVLSAGWDKVVASGTAVFDWIVKAFEPVITIATSIFNFIGDRFDAVMKFAGEVFAAFSKFMMDKFGIDVPLVIDVVKNRVTEIAQPAIDEAQKAKDAVTEYAQKAKESTQEASDAVKDFTSKMWENTKQLGSSAVSAVGDAAGKVGNFVMSTASANETPWRGDNPSLMSSSSKNGSLASILRGGESGKEGYDAYNRGTGLGSIGHQDISKLTLGEIKRRQALNRSDKNRLMAVGMYQMIPATLREAQNHLNLSDDTVFSPEVQEKMFSKYLAGAKRKKIEDYIKGKSNDAQGMGVAAAAEWRSIADPRTGKTYADKGAVGNKASISADSWLSSTNKAREIYAQNLASGMSEDEAYQKALHHIAGSGSVAANKAKDQKPTIIATPEQAEKAMPKPQSSVITAQANAVQPTMPNVTPKQPKIPEQPALVLPMATGAKQAQQPQFLTDIGQDLSDSRLAQIAAPYNGFRVK